MCKDQGQGHGCERVMFTAVVEAMTTEGSKLLFGKFGIHVTYMLLDVVAPVNCKPDVSATVERCIKVGYVHVFAKIFGDFDNWSIIVQRGSQKDGLR